MVCEEDINYQMSMTTLQAYWNIPPDMTLYTPDVFYAIEEQSAVGGNPIPNHYLYNVVDVKISLNSLLQFIIFI